MAEAPQSQTTTRDVALIEAMGRDITELATARFETEEHRGVPFDRYLAEVDSLIDAHLSALLPVFAEAEALPAPPRPDLRLLAASLVFLLAALGLGTGAVLNLRTNQGATTALALFAGASAAVGTTFIERENRRRREARATDLNFQFLRRSRFSSLVDQVILGPALTRAMQVLWGDVAVETVVFTDGAELSSRATNEQRIETAASRRVAVALSRRLGSAVGLSGPRGVGKTEIARSATEKPGFVGVFLPAPMGYDAGPFMLRLLKEVCIRLLGNDGDDLDELAERRGYAKTFRAWAVVSALLLLAGGGVIVGQITGWDIRNASRMEIGGALIAVSYGLAAVLFLRVARRRVPRSQHIERLLRKIEFTETVTAGGEAGVEFKGIGLKRTTGLTRVRTPLSDIDVVREFDRLVQSVGEAQRIVIAIDELDKITKNDEAIEFLNKIKVLFATPYCSFIVSVSESAWAHFEQRGVPFRDAFDSSFDEVVAVDVMAPAESRELLRTRIAAMTDLQALVCHCLSGGLPRDLLRAARSLAYAADRSLDRALAPVVRILLTADLEAKLSAAELRLRELDPDDLHPEAMVDIGKWRDIWENGNMAQYLRTRAPFTAGVDTDIAGQISAVCNRIAGYADYLDTLDAAFAPGGPTARLMPSANDPAAEFTSALVTNGFGGIARARHRLGLDVDGATKELIKARAELGLP